MEDQEEFCGWCGEVLDEGECSLCDVVVAACCEQEEECEACS